MANQGISKALKATMGRALRETGIALKEASGMEVRLCVTSRVLHPTGIARYCTERILRQWCRLAHAFALHTQSSTVRTASHPRNSLLFRAHVLYCTVPHCRYSRDTGLS
jgi:hypothetical protein